VSPVSPHGLNTLTLKFCRSIFPTDINYFCKTMTKYNITGIIYPRSAISLRSHENIVINKGYQYRIKQARGQHIRLITNELNVANKITQYGGLIMRFIQLDTFLCQAGCRPAMWNNQILSYLSWERAKRTSFKAVVFTYYATTEKSENKLNS